jgi:hypothetical protein
MTVSQVTKTKVSSMHWNRTIDVTMLKRNKGRASEKLRVELPPESLEAVKQAIRKELSAMKEEVEGGIWIDSVGCFLTADKEEDDVVGAIEERLSESKAGRAYSIKMAG